MDKVLVRSLGRFPAAVVFLVLLAPGSLPAAAPPRRPPAPPRPFELPSDPRPEPAQTPATRPASAPATGPTARVGADPAKAKQTQALFDHLMGEYRKAFDRSKDRLSRSLVVVCVARVPRADATAMLLDVLAKDKDPLVQMVAWQSVLARTEGLSKADYDKWLALTGPLAAKGAFRGDLRVGLLRLLAVAPPDKRAKELLGLCFANTNSQDVSDLPTIVAMGQAVKAWRDPAIVESFLRRLAVPDEAMRAEAVLHAAGCDVDYAAERWPAGSKAMWQMGMADYADWWRRERANWKPAPAMSEAWRGLEPQYVPSPSFTEPPDPDDPSWHKDLELRPPELKAFEVAFVVDASGSMGEVIAWLRADIRRIADALALAHPQPQIGLTFYRDAKDAFVARSAPLTRRVDQLALRLSQMEAKGGGDQPEAVREGLADCLKASPWSSSPQARKALVLIGDAPPQPRTQAECEKMVENAAKAGFRLYAVKVKTGWEAEDLSAFNRLALAGNGRVFDADLRFGPPAEGEFPFRWWLLLGARMPRFPETDGRQVLPSPHARLPGEEVVAGVLGDAVNPEYQERVRPVAFVLWQMLKEPTKEKHPPFPRAPNYVPPPPKKKDPQRER